MLLGLLYYLVLLELLLHLMYPKNLSYHLFHLNLKLLELLVHLVLLVLLVLLLHLKCPKNLSYHLFHLNLMFQMNQLRLIERLMLKNKSKK